MKNDNHIEMARELNDANKRKGIHIIKMKIKKNQKNMPKDKVPFRGNVERD
jgi:hypothetical protein